MVICRLCHRNTVKMEINFGMQPVAHNLTATPNCQQKKFLFQLGCCTNCGLMQLLDPIPPEILYQNYLTMSGWKNQPHVPRLINIIQSLCGYNHKHKILDIGCNDGTFLETLKKYQYESLFGIEPTDDSYKIANSKGLNVVKSFFTQESSTQFYAQNYFDIIITRHVLEHIIDLADFLSGIVNILKPDGMLVIEIPDSDMNLRFLDYALWEEHVNYFTLNTLKRLLRKFQLEVVHSETTLFSGRALTVFCRRSNATSSEIIDLRPESEKVERYFTKWPSFVNCLHEFLNSYKKNVVMYGCGCRSTNFLNLTDSSSYIDCFIDDQTEKQDLFVPGASTLQVEPWNQKKFEDCIFLLGVNTENEYKVIKQKKLNEDSFFSILPPSFNLPSFWNELIFNSAI